MDPDRNIADQMQLSTEIIEIIDERADDDGVLSDEDKDEVVEKANELAELVQALDAWIKKGGFLPAIWRQKK